MAGTLKNGKRWCGVLTSNSVLISIQRKVLHTRRKASDKSHMKQLHLHLLVCNHGLLVAVLIQAEPEHALQAYS